MSLHARIAWGVVMLAAVGGCATAPPPLLTPEEQYDPESVVVPLPTPMIESPPIEPVEPPLALPPPPPAPAPTPVPAPESPRMTTPAVPSGTVVPVPPPVATEPTEDQQMATLLSDLQRFGALQNDELRRELTSSTQLLSRQRTDVNRVRLAVLYTLLRSSPQDDQRALQLFENVARSAPSASSIRHLASVLQAQVTERQRAVRDEQQKADAAIQKLEALREMERSLLRDRVRGGGGGGGGGGGSGR